ncbi:hypothetical protein C497_06964 [Halalkalicoccus jeotgali B3]|uniref:Uncharacterized protein n=1 Tax=Halalkalicoccus jeotgali (strain DSM 18796 / CECT 7217 / JCM 14584 / KCTC 4019 / B3) TaxID=795797 RepID=D8JBZ5_HALJB|nr:hypothetical protein HacjB3_17798 [Halalkalicoccus jeotgali B3]ELY38661.1 hypothetical protein C497_06964 [Halalkalicoccus jeotgali B3]
MACTQPIVLVTKINNFLVPEVVEYPQQAAESSLVDNNEIDVFGRVLE